MNIRRNIRMMTLALSTLILSATVFALRPENNHNALEVNAENPVLFEELNAQLLTLENKVAYVAPDMDVADATLRLEKMSAQLEEQIAYKAPADVQLDDARQRLEDLGETLAMAVAYIIPAEESISTEGMDFAEAYGRLEGLGAAMTQMAAYHAPESFVRQPDRRNIHSRIPEFAHMSLKPPFAYMPLMPPPFARVL